MNHIKYIKVDLHYKNTTYPTISIWVAFAHMQRNLPVRRTCLHLYRHTYRQTSQYVMPRCVALHHIAFRYSTLQSISIYIYICIYGVTLRYISFRCIALHALQYTTIRCVTLCTKQRCIAGHVISDIMPYHPVSSFPVSPMTPHHTIPFRLYLPKYLRTYIQ